ncbi:MULTISPECIES: hypothetical protein [Oceanobacillus]|uniref:Uncharacterized protein n=1 Tax=Oceanobacillus aidingensis TaxID=645964 RepID=A0ABV9K3A1_9BACI|nr:hypothetical protein [Oceanobacillus oncorhynchi]MDM8099688.1 hypothetical protein [Oceanobacillus oncorhynchi]UUI41861.1 hypothetical protein NP440_10195 [Oceanobacillus oncorhynchi]
MFQATFAAELANRIGSRVEVATDNNLIEGILSTVTADLALVIDVTSGYGDNVKIYISVDAINFVRFLVAA